MRCVLISLVGLAACDTQEPEVLDLDSGVELVEAIDQSIPIDEPLGWVRMEGPFEIAPIEVEPSPASGGPELQDWSGTNAWTLAEVSCLSTDDGPREALLAHPMGGAAMLGFPGCSTPAWCDFVARRLPSADAPLQSVLGQVSTRCMGPVFDAWYTREDAPVEARFQRVLNAPVWRPVATRGLAARVAEAASDEALVGYVPFLIERIALNEGADGFGSELIRASRHLVGEPRTRIGVGLGVLDDPSSQAAFSAACASWEGRDDWRCTDSWSAAFDPAAEVGDDDVLAMRAAGGATSLRLWARNLLTEDASARERLVERLSGCVGQPMSPWHGAVNLACAQTLVELDADAARQAIRRAGAPAAPAVRSDMAALKLGPASAVAARLDALDLLPGGAGTDLAAPHLTPTRILQVHGRAWPIPSPLNGPEDQDLLLHVALQLSGLRVREVQTADGPGPGLTSLEVWTDRGHYRGLAATDKGQSPSGEAWMTPDQGGTLAFVNGILADEGHDLRLFEAEDPDGWWYVAGPREGLATAIDQRLLTSVPMDPATRRAHQQALAEAAETAAELDTGEW